MVPGIREPELSFISMVMAYVVSRELKSRIEFICPIGIGIGIDIFKLSSLYH